MCGQTFIYLCQKAQQVATHQGLERRMNRASSCTAADELKQVHSRCETGEHKAWQQSHNKDGVCVLSRFLHLASMNIFYHINIDTFYPLSDSNYALEIYYMCGHEAAYAG